MAILVALCVIVYVLSRRDEPASNTHAGSSGDVSEASPSGTASAALTRVGDADAAINDAATKHSLLNAKWGSGSGELGRSKPQEGNPEGPMSFARSPDGDLLVLDQVNSRVSRFDKNGKFKNSFDSSLTTQDIAVGKDGSVATLDRLVEKTVRIVDANGHAVGTLPLPDRVGDPGLVTGVFVDGKDVFVEKEHGVLMRVGGIDGSVANEATDLTGRPSKDGVLLLSVVFNAQAGQVHLNAFDRNAGALRFARLVQFPRPAHQVALLDTDAKGTIYIGVIGGVQIAVNIACLDPADGHVIGRIVLPAQNTPEESFRDFSVSDDGTITYSLRSDDGIDFQTATCP